MKSSRTQHNSGDLIAKRYEITEHVGGGGQASVYLAKDKMNNNRLVIVKMLVFQSFSKKGREEELVLFSREAEVFGKVTHPFIPELYDFFEEKGKHYIVEQYIQGKTLEKIIKSIDSPLTSDQVLSFLSDIIDLLECLHNQDPPIIVRDIKPGNIIIDHQWKPHLIDFTIAREHIPGKGDTVRMGSPGYAPPEQYRGMTDPRSDIYSLGATAYQMITGFDPAHKPFALPGIRTENPDVDKDLEMIIQKAIALDPEERYQDVSQMKQDVEKAILKRNTGSCRLSAVKLSKSLFITIGALLLIFSIILLGLKAWDHHNLEKQNSIKKVGQCFINLSKIAVALENYVEDHDGKLPANLRELVPEYLQEVPHCPAAGTDTYSESFHIIEKESENPEQPRVYVIYCKGFNHKDAGLGNDSPRFEKGRGIE